MDVSKPLVNQGLWKERVPFMFVKNVVKHKSKIVTSDVDITVVLVVEVKIKKSSFKIFQKR